MSSTVRNKMRQLEIVWYIALLESAQLVMLD